MKLETRCKLCNQPLTVTVDTAYAGIGGDPFKLLPGACHDRCIDLYNAKRAAGRVLYSCCLDLMLKPKDAVRLKLVVRITKATKAYAEALAKQHHAPLAVWDSALPELIIERPQQWRDIMRDYTTRAVAEFKRPLAAPPRAALPYAD